MAKQPDSAGVPKVTSLPLPSSDSVLVIDLPDGQKLLVGKMESGSVIEVATWRGTGRPDSRTNRLMLGMSSGEDQTMEEDEQSEQAQFSNKFSSQYIRYLFQTTFRNVNNTLKESFTQLRDFKFSRIKKVQSSSSEFDVEAWLNKIKQTASSKVEAPSGARKAGKSISVSGQSQGKASKKSKKTTRNRSR